MKARKVIAGAILPLVLACLPGCSMLPEEEEYRSAPVLKDYQQQEYTLTTVLRGDMELTSSIYCRYEPVKEEKLGFGVGGLYYEDIYVQKGDYVTAGTLMAELQMGTLKTDISNCESKIAKLEMQQSQAQEMMSLKLERHRIYLETLDDEQRAQAPTLNEKREELSEQLQSIADSLYIAKLELAELDTKRDQRQIVAGMDGTVMYIRSHKDGDTSIENANFITLSDTESSMFTMETEYYEYFQPGDTMNITVSKVVYPVQVTTAAELGLDEPELTKDGKKTVYLKLLEPAVDLESGDRGTVVIIQDTREDVLYVSVKAITTADGHAFVYYVDDEGMRRVKEVQTGLETKDYVEIISGLSEGDEIIMS